MWPFSRIKKSEILELTKNYRLKPDEKGLYDLQYKLKYTTGSDGWDTMARSVKDIEHANKIIYYFETTVGFL